MTIGDHTGPCGPIGELRGPYNGLDHREPYRTIRDQTGQVDNPAEQVDNAAGQVDNPAGQVDNPAGQVNFLEKLVQGMAVQQVKSTGREVKVGLP